MKQYTVYKFMNLMNNTDYSDQIKPPNFVSYMTKNTNFRKIAQIIQLAILEITL